MGCDHRGDRRPVRARPVRLPARPRAHGRVPRGGRSLGLVPQRRNRLRRDLRTDRRVGAVFGVTDEGFIVFAANAFALLGLRALYFLVSGLLDRLVYLSTGLSLILAF